MLPDVHSGIGEVIITVAPDMTATLDGTEIHPVYSTFWLAYHAELAARRAIEPYFEYGDNAVGSGLHIAHVAMAGIGAQIKITARVTEVTGRRIRCSFEAHVLPSRTLIATGTQDQVVLPTEALAERARNAVTT